LEDRGTVWAIGRSRCNRRDIDRSRYSTTGGILADQGTVGGILADQGTVEGILADQGTVGGILADQGTLGRILADQGMVWDIDRSRYSVSYWQIKVQ
jgi:hypothetical protein